MKKEILNVKGMSCQHCVNTIESTLKNMGASATVNLSNQTVTVEYDEREISLASIKEAIEDQGYDVI
ncbi:copper ion binding protein [Thermoflavimicrobium dichotomicum]|uniref:Copper chaperone n=1 Tax=Thermoflavimicrobium dichotomicum TaxID=46223 RepID=A0A1I3JNT0_9BACL|nr:copper ion binding protein [Thermoflavimicrobium dichotomicum]SFI61932.1 copper chaperone [Thermoflavimicrobium dichotomicum]